MNWSVSVLSFFWCWTAGKNESSHPCNSPLTSKQDDKFLQFWLSNEKETNSLSRRLCSQHFAPSSCQCGCLLVLMLTGVNWHGSINMWLGEVKRWFEEKKLREIDSLRVWCVGFDVTVSILQRKGVSRSSFFCWYSSCLIRRVCAWFHGEAVVRSAVLFLNRFFLQCILHQQPVCVFLCH